MTTKEFMEKMVQDEALRRKLTATKTAEEGYAVAKEAGVTDDLKTFVAAVTKNELSDAELGSVASGTALAALRSWEDWKLDLARLMR